MKKLSEKMSSIEESARNGSYRDIKHSFRLLFKNYKPFLKVQLFAISPIFTGRDLPHVDGSFIYRKRGVQGPDPKGSAGYECHGPNCGQYFQFVS